MPSFFMFNGKEKDMKDEKQFEGGYEFDEGIEPTAEELAEAEALSSEEKEE